MVMSRSLKIPEKQLHYHCTKCPDFVELWQCSVFWNSQKQELKCHYTKCTDFVEWKQHQVVKNSTKKNHSVTALGAHFWGDIIYYYVITRTYLLGQVRNYPHLKKCIIIFKQTGKLTMLHSIKNQMHWLKWFIQLIISNYLSRNVSSLRSYCIQNNQNKTWSPLESTNH